MRQLLKFLHTMGAIGMMGAMAALLVLLLFTPEPSSLAEYAQMRLAMGALAEWVLLPSLALTLVSGLFSMAYTSGFHNAGWVWVKLATGVLMFEGTLMAVQGPAQREAALSKRALAGDFDPSMLGRAVQAEWASLWVVLGIAALNVALGVWRPKFMGSRRSRRSPRTGT